MNILSKFISCLNVISVFLLITNCSNDVPQSNTDWDVIWNIDYTKATGVNYEHLLIGDNKLKTLYYENITSLFLKDCRIIANFNPRGYKVVNLFSTDEDLLYYWEDNRDHNVSDWHQAYSHFFCQGSKWADNREINGDVKNDIELGFTPGFHEWKLHFVFEVDIRDLYEIDFNEPETAQYFVVASVPHEIAHYKYGLEVHYPSGNHSENCCLLLDASKQLNPCGPQPLDYRKVKFCSFHATDVYPK